MFISVRGEDRSGYWTRVAVVGSGGRSRMTCCAPRLLARKERRRKQIRLIKILEAEDSVEQRLLKTIRFNARIIQKMEGKSYLEAVYWSIRTLLDSLRTQVRGEDDRKIVIEIVR